MLSCHFQQGLDLMDSLGWVFGDAFSLKSAQHCMTAWGWRSASWGRPTAVGVALGVAGELGELFQPQ